MSIKLIKLRKNLKLSQEEFGKRLGVTGASISRLESGDRNLTEQMKKSICREFGVNPEYLETGEGEMFSFNDDIENMVERIMSRESKFYQNLFKTLANASDDDLNALERLVDSFLKFSSEEDSACIPEFPDTAEEFEEQFGVEKDTDLYIG